VRDCRVSCGSLEVLRGGFTLFLGILGRSHTDQCDLWLPDFCRESARNSPVEVRMNFGDFVSSAIQTCFRKYRAWLEGIVLNVVFIIHYVEHTTGLVNMRLLAQIDKQSIII